MNNIKHQIGVFIDSFFAPFHILKVEKIYIWWMAGFLFSFAGLLIDLLNGSIRNSLNNGAVYTTCIALIIPLILEFITDYKENHRKQEKESYSSYKSNAFVMCFISLVVCFILYATVCKSMSIVQFFTSLVVLFVTFYTYLVSKMSTHHPLLKQYEDKPYYQDENEALQRLSIDAHKLDDITIDNKQVKL